MGICPSVTGLKLDVRTSRDNVSCAGGNDLAVGIFTPTSIKDAVIPYDVDSVVAELRGSVVGKVRVTRERIESGTVRPLTMTSIGTVTARDRANGRRGTFTISGWEGS